MLMKDYDTWLTSPDPANSPDSIRLEKRVNIINLNAETLFDTPLNCLFLHLDRHAEDWDKAEALFKQCLMTEEFRAFLKMAVLSEATHERIFEEKKQREDCELPTSHYHSFLCRKYR